MIPLKIYLTLLLSALLSVSVTAQITYRNSAPDVNSEIQALIPWGDSVIIKKELGKEVVSSGTHFLVGTNTYSSDAIGNPDVFSKTYQVENGFLFHYGKRFSENLSDQLIRVDLATGTADYLDLPLENQGIVMGSTIRDFELFNGFVYLLVDNFAVGRKVLRVETTTLMFDNAWNTSINQNLWVSEIHSFDLVNNQLVFLSENAGVYSLKSVDLNNQNVSSIASVSPFALEGQFSKLVAINDTLFSYSVNSNGMATQYFYSSNGYSENISINGEVLQSFEWDGSFYLSGSFQLSGQTEYLAELDLNTMNLQAITGLNGKVEWVNTSASQIELLGDFTSFNGVQANGKIVLDNQFNVLYNFESSSISGAKDHAFLNGNDTLLIGHKLKVEGNDLAEEIIYNPSTNQFDEVPSYLQGKIVEGTVNNHFLYYELEGTNGEYEFYTLNLNTGQITLLGAFTHGGKEVFTDFKNRRVFADQIFNQASSSAYLVAYNLDNFQDTTHLSVAYFAEVIDVTASSDHLFVMGTTEPSNPNLQIFKYPRQGFTHRELIFDKNHDGPGNGVYNGGQIEYNPFQNQLVFGFSENGTMETQSCYNYLFSVTTNSVEAELSASTSSAEPENFVFNALVPTESGLFASGSEFNRITHQTTEVNAFNAFYHYNANTHFDFVENGTPNFRDSVRLELNHLVGTPNYIYGGAKHADLRGFVVFKRAHTFTSVDEVETDRTSASSLKVFPVPAENQLNLKWTRKEAAQAQICDINGRVIVQKQLLSGYNFFDVSQFNSGVYFVFLPETGEKVKWVKF